MILTARDIFIKPRIPVYSGVCHSKRLPLTLLLTSLIFNSYAF
jgi:hypothetical protein